MIEVRSPGVCSLIVDAGRPGARQLGVPLGGAADRLALAAGNALVGNLPDMAGLEIALAGPTLVARGTVAGVVFGAPFDLASDRQSLHVGRTFTLRAGEVLRIGGCVRGLRAYLCVPGGFDTPLILGCRSGLAPIKAGDDLPCRGSTLSIRTLASALLEPWSQRGHRVGPVTLRCLPGGESTWFDLSAFTAEAWTVRPDSNRMGVRLDGRPLDRPTREIASEPVAPGTVQVTNDGRCIVLGVDAQTIGGYPKVAQVIGADLDVLGQSRPGDRLRFQWVTLAEAERLAEGRREFLRWLARARMAGESSIPGFT